MAEAVINLTQAARKSGGDKYEGTLAGTVLTIYVPQVISRSATGHPADKLKISIENCS